MLTATATGVTRSRQPRRHTVGLSVGLSTSAFLVADTLEHSLFDLPYTPPALVLFGVGLHAILGAATSLFWLAFTRVVPTIPVARDADTPAVARPRIAAFPPTPRREHLWAAAVTGRAPPTVTA